jgi:exodeoxyribonuclease VIII
MNIFQRVELTNEQYHAEKEHISSSGLKEIYSKGLWSYLQNKDVEKKQTPAMVFGSAYHCYALEPDKFLDEYCISQKFDGRTKQGKADKAEFERINAGKTVINEEDFAKIVDMQKALQNFLSLNPDLYNIWETSESEVSFFGVVENTPVKIRYDKYNSAFGISIDLKTTQDASPKGFPYEIRKYKYDIQDYHYRLNADRFIIIAQEKEYPYLVQAYELGVDSRAYGESKWKEAMSLYDMYRVYGHDELDTSIQVI